MDCDIAPRTITVQTFDDGWQYIVIADPAYTWTEADIACAKEAMAEAAKPLPCEKS